MTSTKQLLEIIAIQTEIAKLGLDLAGTMALVVDRMLSLLDADGAVIELAEDYEMVYRATSGSAVAQLGLRLRRVGSLSGLCINTGAILCCDDSELDTRVDRAACRRVGLRSMIVAPLKHQGETVGVLKAFSAQIGKFRKDDVEVLGLLTDVIAAAMYYATKYNIDELRYQATHDTMSGLANRALFIDRLRGRLDEYARTGQGGWVLLIDMDGLKRINDTYGHRAGDAAIITFARVLRACAREDDIVARLGGDEFGIILSAIDTPPELDGIVERINAKLSSSLCFEMQHFRLAASIGMAQYPADGTDIDRLLEVADQRMYQEKKAHLVQVNPNPSLA